MPEVIPLYFHSEDISFQLENSNQIQSWLLKVMENESKKLVTLTYIFCSDEYLLQINQQYLQHDYYTDVITFPYSNTEIEGDIFISIDRIRDNAQSLNIPEETELHRVMVHGLLHLIGYDDKTPELKKLMQEKENFYLNWL